MIDQKTYLIKKRFNKDQKLKIQMRKKHTSIFFIDSKYVLLRTFKVVRTFRTVKGKIRTFKNTF